MLLVYVSFMDIWWSNFHCMCFYMSHAAKKKKIHHETSSSHKYSGKEKQAQWWWSSGFICWMAAWSPSGVKRNTQALLAEKYACFSPSCLSRPVPAINCLFGICVQECSDYYPLACFFLLRYTCCLDKACLTLRTFRGHEDIWTFKQSKGDRKLKKRWLTVSLQLKSALVDLLSLLHNPVIPYSRPQLIATENMHTDAPHSF